ncbi:hypothetical protein ACIGZJ_33965, partial [Kitasatospora sp. NPDC052868]
MRVRKAKPPGGSAKGWRRLPRAASRARAIPGLLRRLVPAAAVTAVLATGLPLGAVASAQAPALAVAPSLNPATLSRAGEAVTFSLQVT